MSRSLQSLSVAVVVPTHSRPIELKRALLSVLAQSHAAQQIIVVDDSVDPESEHVADELGVEYVGFPLGRGDTPGPSRSRNHGASMARSEVVAFLDDDDEWDSKYLETVLSEYEATDCCATVGMLLQRSGEVCSPHPQHQPFDIESLSSGNPSWFGTGVSGSNFSAKLSSFRSVGGYDVQLVTSEDWDLAARLAASGGRISSVPKAIAIQSVDGSDHLTNKSARNEEAINAYLRKHGGKLQTNERRQLMAFRHAQGRRSENPAYKRFWHLAAQFWFEPHARKFEMLAFLLGRKSALTIREK